MTEALVGSGFRTLEQAQNPAYSEVRFREVLLVTSFGVRIDVVRAEEFSAVWRDLSRVAAQGHVHRPHIHSRRPVPVYPEHGFRQQITYTFLRGTG